MRYVWGSVVVVLLVLVGSGHVSARQQRRSPSVPPAVTPVRVSSRAGQSNQTDGRALVNRYCVTCHNERLKTAGLLLDKMDWDRVPEGAATWEKVLRKLRGGMMPPQGAPRPEQPSIDAFVSGL